MINSWFPPNSFTGMLLILPSPLFVTWNTRSSRSGVSPRLRGCIGSFEPLSLHEGLAEYALISAFRDTRFRKIEENELEKLECGFVNLASSQRIVFELSDPSGFRF